MNRNMQRAGLVLALVFIIFAQAPAVTNGKISGVITDAKTGERLPGVNVLIVGSSSGAVTDLQGRYFILNISPGVYSVKTSFLGYVGVTQTGVQVNVDKTTELNFALSQTVIAGEEVTVLAARPSIEKTLTQSKTTVAAAELNNTLPIASFKDLVETSPSAYHGYIRGGRKYETKILVDGVDVSDAYFSGGTGAFGSGDIGHSYQGFRRSELDETSVGTVPSSAIQEMNVYAGTFNAEYPTASAGIVNLVTKSGGDAYTGKIFFRFTPLNKWDHFGSNPYWMKDSYPGGEGYFAEKQKWENAGTVFGKRSAALYTWTPQLAQDQYYYDPDDSTGLGRSVEVEGNLSGPIPFLGKKSSFFLSGLVQNLRTSALPFDMDKRATVTLKLNYAFTSNKKLTVFSQLEDGGKLFDFVNWKYNPRWIYYMEGAPRYKDLSTVYYAKWTHTLSAKTFYEIQLSQNNKTSWIGYPDDNGDGYCDIGEKGDFIEFKNADEYQKYVGGITKTDTIRDAATKEIKSIETYIDTKSLNGYLGDWYRDPTNKETVLAARDPRRAFFYQTIDPQSGVNETKANFWKTDGAYRTRYPAPLYSRTTRNVAALKADLTSQISFQHQLKAGAQFRYHTIDVDHLQAELAGAGRSYPYSMFHVDQHYFNPLEMAAYLQDRVEYKGMILNIGARLDGYDNDTEYFENDFHPWNYLTFASGYLKEMQPVRGDRVGWKWFFNPRVGVSHPVSENMAMHYSFGKFVQYPNFSSLYSDYNFTNYSASPGMTTVWVDQQPIRSTAYEIGVQYSPMRDFTLDANVYYRDVDNYSNLNFSLVPYKGQTLYLQTSWGNADARGIELSIEKRPNKHWTMRMSYSYSYIKAATAMGGLSAKQRRDFTAKVDSALYSGLPFDNLDQYNYRLTNIVLRSTSNALAGGFDRTHRFAATAIVFLPLNIQASLIGEAQSGFKYYPTENTESDPWFSVSPKLREGPWNYCLNVRLSWEGKINGLRIRPFAEARNVTNHKNILAYNNTPQQESTDQKIWELGRDFIAGSGDENDPEGYRRVPHDWLGRLLYGPSRQIWVGMELGF